MENRKKSLMEILDDDWEKLTFANNFFFNKIMSENPDLCQHLIEILLGIKIDHLEMPTSEKVMQSAVNSRGIRMDVFVKDEQRIYDIEIQTSIPDDLARRVRYYQATLDTTSLKPGETYSDLKDSYILFLCTKDPFNKKLPFYRIKNICENDSSVNFDDGAYKIFYNAADYDKMANEELKLFFRYLEGGKADSSFTQTIDRKVKYLKLKEDVRKEFMTWEMELKVRERKWFREGKEEGEKKGKKEGKEEAFVESAKKMLEMGFALEQISQCTNLSIEKVKELAALKK